jgi:predicted MPP superfamily phosphohydrolase
MKRRAFLKWAVRGTLGTSLLGVGYARFEATWVRITRHTVAVPRLPAPFVGKTVALLTDPHHGPFNSLSYLRSVVALTNGLAPDLVALGGDYVHGPSERSCLDPCLRTFGELRAPLGVYAVPGNHDHWNSGRDVRRAFRENGILDVTNDGRWVEVGGSRLRLAGVDDLWTGKQDLDAALGSATEADACLLLSHNPDYAETLTDPRVGLVLSGHLHGGQITLPGLGYARVPSRYGLKYLAGLVRAPHTQVFVSRGLGTITLPFRFCCRPEINLLTLAAGPGGHGGA